MAIVYRNVKGSPLSADEYDQNINEVIALSTNRANHTGFQLSNTISDFATAVENLPLITGPSGLKTKLDLLTNFTTPVDIGALVNLSHPPLTINGPNSNGLSINQQELSLSLASSVANGALSSTDWNIFNNKISSASSLGTSPNRQDIYAGQVGTSLRFKSLTASNGLTLTSNSNEINISLTDNITNSIRVRRYAILASSMVGSTTVLDTLPPNSNVLFFRTKVDTPFNEPADIAIKYGSDTVIDFGVINPESPNQSTIFDVTYISVLPTDVSVTIGSSLATVGTIFLYVGYIIVN